MATAPRMAAKDAKVANVRHQTADAMPAGRRDHVAFRDAEIDETGRVTSGEIARCGWNRRDRRMPPRSWIVLGQIGEFLAQNKRRHRLRRRAAHRLGILQAQFVVRRSERACSWSCPAALIVPSPSREASAPASISDQASS